jgi:hypothetical protein
MGFGPYQNFAYNKENRASQSAIGSIYKLGQLELKSV